MKVVIISKVSYPKLSPRSHRTTELAKEFVRQGHDVVVYALLGDFDYTSYEKETGIVFKNLGKSKFGIDDNTGYWNKNYFYRAARKYIGRLLEFPHIELISMVKKVLKSEGEIDYLISIAHPHTIHWGVADYVRRYEHKIKFWVADCGDPFMGSPFRKHPSYFEKQERSWCELCNYITVPIEEAKAAYYPEYKEKIHVIPQGFDFDSITLAEYSANPVPTFCFSGVVYKDLRDPSAFLDYLSHLGFEFKFIVYTKSVEIFNQYKEILKDKLEIRDYVSHDKLLFELSKMDFLINIQNESGVQQPSKLIDYASTRRPILNISSGFAERVVFDEFINGNFSNQNEVADIEEYNIKRIVSKYIELLNQTSIT